MTVKQTQYEWVYLFGAVNPVTGDSSALLAPTVNTAYMNHHLRFISERVGSDVQVVLVLDQAGWHLSKGLQVPENLTLLYLPPYSPELNPVERLWAFLKSHYLSNRVYENYDHLLQSCGQAWNHDDGPVCSICHTDGYRLELIIIRMRSDQLRHVGPVAGCDDRCNACGDHCLLAL
jgi:transposase